MADIFLKDDDIKFFKENSILFIVDSIMRNIQEDFSTLIITGKLTSHGNLQKKSTQMPIYARDELEIMIGPLVPGRDLMWSEIIVILSMQDNTF